MAPVKSGFDDEREARLIESAPSKRVVESTKGNRGIVLDADERIVDGLS
jgi:hypothetical protein